LQTELKILPTEEFLEQYRAKMLDLIMRGNKKIYNYHPKQNAISEDPWNDGRICFVIFLIRLLR